MAKVGQEEIADPHGIEGIHAPQDDDDHNEVIIGGKGPIKMPMKGKMMVDQKVRSYNRNSRGYSSFRAKLRGFNNSRG